MSAVSSAFIAALVLAATHVLAGKARLGSGSHQRRVLSFGSGISVAYVFVLLMPEIAEGQSTLEAHSGGVPFLERHAYLMALVGLVLFYGLERGARRSVGAQGRGDGGFDARWFTVHLATFAAYSLLIGYLLVAQADEYGATGLALYAVAIGVHFVVNDKGLQRHHPDWYRHLGRWLLAGALMAGWALGALTEVSEAAVAGLLALLGGAIILNVLKEELPAESESSFWAFALGAGAYAVLLIAV